MDKRTDGQKDRWTKGQMDKKTKGKDVGQTDIVMEG